MGGLLLVGIWEVLSHLVLAWARTRWACVCCPWMISGLSIAPLDYPAFSLITCPCLHTCVGGVLVGRIFF